MCLLAVLLNVDAATPLALVHVRDELLARAAAAPCAHARVVAGADLRAGGAWAGWARDARVAVALTNVRAVFADGGGGGGSARRGSGEADAMTGELLRTLTLDLEAEKAARRVAEAALAQLNAAPAALDAATVDALGELEAALEGALRRVRGARERKMRDALGDEQSRVLCAVCMAAQKTTLFLPCKHLCACAACAARVMATGPPPLCPMCRAEARSTLDVYA